MIECVLCHRSSTSAIPCPQGVMGCLGFRMDNGTAKAGPDPDPDRIRLHNLRRLMGYVENGTSRSVKISQDDATKAFFISWGGGKEFVIADSLEMALDLLGPVVEKMDD